MTKVRFAVVYVEISACHNVYFSLQHPMCHILFLLKVLEFLKWIVF